MPMATKFDRMVTYLEGFPPITSRDPLIAWACEVTGQVKYIVSSLSPDQRTPNLARW